MTPERWHRVTEIFHGAILLPHQYLHLSSPMA